MPDERRKLDRRSRGPKLRPRVHLKGDRESKLPSLRRGKTSYLPTKTMWQQQDFDLDMNE